MHCDHILRTLFKLATRLHWFYFKSEWLVLFWTSGISGHADVWRPVHCTEELICQPYLQSVFTQSHEILKSMSEEPPKLLSSSGIRGTSAFWISSYCRACRKICIYLVIFSCLRCYLYFIVQLTNLTIGISLPLREMSISAVTCYDEINISLFLSEMNILAVTCLTFYLI